MDTVLCSLYSSTVPTASFSNSRNANLYVIIRAAQEFEDPVWRSYDEAFHEKAAATGNKKWSEIDTHIYNQLFTGHARKVDICKHCNATNHSSDHCPSKTRKQIHEDSDDNPPMTKRILQGLWQQQGGREGTIYAICSTAVVRAAMGTCVGTGTCVLLAWGITPGS